MFEAVPLPASPPGGILVDGFPPACNSRTWGVGRLPGPAWIYKNWANFLVFWKIYALTFAETNFSGPSLFQNRGLG